MTTILEQKAHWETDLVAVPELVVTVTKQVQSILDEGMRQALQTSF